jgi:hypothetical protein
MTERNVTVGGGKRLREKQRYYNSVNKCTSPTPILKILATEETPTL